MRAIPIAVAGAPLAITEVAMPDPGRGAVRVRVHACGICHSDMFTVNAAYPGIALPRVPGHEIAGTIDAVGEGVTTWKAGDRVGVGWFGGADGTCESCRRGDFITCRNGKVSGISAPASRRSTACGTLVRCPAISSRSWASADSGIWAFSTLRRWAFAPSR